MNIGIICEYNPFHNGHLYHINKIKELYKDCNIILVMSSNFLQRGDASLIDKWDKTDIALEYGVDIVIELPFVFSTQSADTFARGAIQILKNMNVDAIVFGSEINNIEVLTKIANIQTEPAFNISVQKYMSDGINYPTAISRTIKDMLNIKIDTPNDLLAVSYIKEINRQDANIKPICIKRTNDFHEKELNNSITSATSIRNALKNNIDVKNYVPKLSYEYLKKDLYFTEDYFELLKYKIISTSDLSIYQTVDEGIGSRIKKMILKSNSLDELIDNVKTKRYTHNKIKRMLVHILCGFTKKQALKMKNSEYIRILGFNEKGRLYLNKVKKMSKLPIITGYSNIKSDILDLELKVSQIYYLTSKEKNKNYLMELEYKHKPIIK